MATKRIRKKALTPTYTVEAGEVKVVDPQEELEVVSVAETPATRPRITIGRGVFEYVGDCAECAVKNPPVKTEVFDIVEGSDQDAAAMGDQLVAYRRDGATATPLCQACHNKWLGKQPQDVIRYKFV